jgi:hypothetical protein
MACDIITKGRKLACKDSRKGVKAFYFSPFEEYNFTVVGQEIATLPVSLTDVFKYEVKGEGNKFEDVPSVDLATRTTEFKETINMLLQKISKETEVELKALVFSTVVGFVEDFNGNIFVCGMTNGLDATTAPMSTDTSGFSVTLEGMESTYAPLLSATAKTAFKALVSTAYVTP